MPGTLFVVATPIGNLEDVSARALRVLREAAVIAAEDTRRTAQLLARYGITTPTTSLHEHNEGRKAAALVERLKRGESIALVSDAGTPTVSDPGRYLIQAVVEASVRIEPIPGPSAALAALAVSGFPADTFIFLGFPPTRSKDRKQWYSDVRRANRTVVFFEAPHRIRRTLEELLQTVGDRQVCVCRELTKTHEELVRGLISEVLRTADRARGEYTVVLNIGHETENSVVEPPALDKLATEFGVLTNIGAVSRREAISTLARKYQMSGRAVYAAIERAKKSGK